ncbi:MAG: hypothetical protein H5U21_07990 [Porphyrobacter sp.]|nr:hypothetical protein [Porphyrobacter sp.]
MSTTTTATAAQTQARVTSDLFGAETALNQALMSQARLLTTMIAARQQAGDAFIGHEAMIRLVKAQQTLLTAGSDLARVHGRLREIGREQGLVIHDCPPNEPMDSATLPPSEPVPHRLVAVK